MSPVSRLQFVPSMLSITSVLVVASLHPRVAEGVARPMTLAEWLLPSLAGGLVATQLSLVAPGVARDSTLVNIDPALKTRWRALPPDRRAIVDAAAARLLVGLACFLWLLGASFQLMAWSHAHGATRTTSIPWPLFVMPVLAMVVGLGGNAVEEAIRRAERVGA